MKIIKNKQPEQLDELFGRKKKTEPVVEPIQAPEKTPINRYWDEHYKMLETLRKTCRTQFSAGLCFVADSGLPADLAHEIVQSWLDNYDELARKFHWNTAWKDED
jgi:hypothetical protein